jgi:hypothetical protein
MAGHTHHGFELQQRQGYGRIVQVYFTHFDLLHWRLRQRIQIDLKTQ